MVGNLLIEILPKVDRSSPNDSKLQKQLLTMLHDCRYLKLDSLTSATLRLKSASLADLFIESFINETWNLVHNGLVKRYELLEDNIKYLKGQLIFSRHIQKNFVNKERFYTAHTVYNFNNTFNQILKAALLIVNSTKFNEYLTSSAKQLLYHFDDIECKEFDLKTFDRLKYDRKTERYRYSMKLAELIITQYSPDISSGKEDILSILFDMNKLFEEFVFVNLKRRINKGDYPNFSISSQKSKLFWRNKKIRPDIIIKKDEKIEAIIDTKWKVPAGNNPDDADLKQLYVYNMQFGSTKSILFYPKINECNQLAEEFNESRICSNIPVHSLQMWFSELFSDDGKKKEFAEEFLQNVIPLP
jgi:5-methylcytosine-specific restriction enzyme subunit McrC